MSDPATASAKAEDYFVSSEEGSRHTIFPGVQIQTMAGRQIMLSLVTFEPDGVVLDHAHPHEQVGMLISGNLEFTIGGITRTIGPGDKWRIPGGVSHRVRAVNGPAVALDVFNPIREDYL
ncbi:MAG: cupin [Planctomycetes bacterium SCN 63-9]|nr:MAG: cupin [Planctomycetes bacterium SCN 63-9]